jgi:hypothetical protein
VSGLNMESSAASSVEGCDPEVREGANLDWGVVGMSEAGGRGFDLDLIGRAAAAE